MEEAKIYAYDLDFHNQLKAALLDTKAVVQVVRETSLDQSGLFSKGSRRLQDPATVAWNLTTTSYFKAGGRLRKLHAGRDGVCYIGIVLSRMPKIHPDRVLAVGRKCSLIQVTD
jgi:hypothetical protein